MGACEDYSELVVGLPLPVGHREVVVIGEVLLDVVVLVFIDDPFVVENKISDFPRIENVATFKERLVIPAS